MTWEDFVAIALELPEVEEGLSYGRPSLKVRGKYMAGLNPKEKAFVLRLKTLAMPSRADFSCTANSRFAQCINNWDGRGLDCGATKVVAPGPGRRRIWP